MDAITCGDEDRINAELYLAIMQGNDVKAFEMCGALPNGAFHVITIHHDTIFHMAILNKRNNLVVALLRSLHETQFEKLTWISGSGNTILHAATTNNGTIEAAGEMLRRAPSLLTMTNKRGETPLFHAARYGKTRVFKFLSAQVRKATQNGADLNIFLLRDDKSTILHASILSENFDLAIFITETYPQLIGQEDGDGVTGLQLLACNPSAFDSGVGNNLFKKLIYNYVDSSSSPATTSRVPVLKEIQRRKRRCESAKELAKILIRNDKSWKETQSISDHSTDKFHKYKRITSTTDERDMPSTPYTPLLLATKNGCTDIVREILNVYPQAMEHIDGDGRNIIHVAIKYRRIEVIDTVAGMWHSVRRIGQKIDKKGNSLLHMVGIKAKDGKAESDVRSPALVLRDDLLLFERLKNTCPTLTSLQINSDRKTAHQLLVENNAQLRIDAKEWMKRTAENCTIVAVLIATVAFAAAYTVPGGPDQTTGHPLLKNEPFFIVFALADALSLTFSLTSVVIFLSILTSSFRLGDFRNSLHNKLLVGMTLLILSISMMMVAFAATLILTISSHRYWTNAILYIISFFPVTVFVVSYVKLYTSLIKAFVEKMLKIKEAVFPSHGHRVRPPQADFTRFTSPSLSTRL